MGHFMIEKKDRLHDQLSVSQEFIAWLRDLAGKAEEEDDRESVAFLQMCVRTILSPVRGSMISFSRWKDIVLQNHDVAERDAAYAEARECLYENLRRLHGDSGYSIRQVAEYADVSPTTVAALLRAQGGRGMPHRRTLERIARVYGATLEELFLVTCGARNGMIRAHRVPARRHAAGQHNEQR